MRVRKFLLSGVLLCLSAFSSAQTTYSELVVFGDSLSDTGNLAGALTPNLPPPYFDNRISNGPLAIDVLAESLGENAVAAAEGGNNFAVAGGNILGSDLGDLSAQVNRLLLREQNQLDPQALYIIFMGGNDLRDLRGITDRALAAQRTEEILAALATQLERLSVFGAKHFLVANSADVGRIPQTLALDQSAPGLAARASDYVRSYNAKLLMLLQKFVNDQNAKVFVFDAFEELNKILDSPAEFGFDVTETGCLDPMDSFNPFAFEFDAGCDEPLFPFVQPDFEGYVFFDSIHPTAATHALIGQALLQSLLAAPIRPATDHPILLSGVLLLLLAD